MFLSVLLKGCLSACSWLPTASGSIVCWPPERLLNVPLPCHGSTIRVISVTQRPHDDAAGDCERGNVPGEPSSRAPRANAAIQLSLDRVGNGTTPDSLVEARRSNRSS